MLFTSHDLTFKVRWIMCDNPDCPCTESRVHFEESDARERPLKGGRTFEATFDLSAGTETAPPPRSDLIESIVKDFQARGREGLFASILQGRSDAALEQKRISEYVMGLETIQEGLLVSYTEIASGEDNLARGGRACSFSVDYQGRTYYFDDLYCPKPACRCGEVVLIVLGEAVDSAGQECIRNAFDATVTLRGKVSINETHHAFGETKARDVVKALLAHDTDLLKTFRAREKTVKAIATRSLATTLSGPTGTASSRTAPARSGLPVLNQHDSAPSAPAGPTAGEQSVAFSRQKVGRNDPCPCQSGRKYKKCCGA